MAADLRRELRALLIKAGLAADDAATAADVSERALRSRRDAMIALAIANGVSTRDAARVWGVGKTHAHRLATSCPVLPERPVKVVRKNDEGNAGQSGAMRGQTAPLLVDFDGAVSMVSLSEGTFKAMVKNGTMPGPVRVSPGRVAWRVKDLVAWVDSRPLASTAQESQAA